MKTGMRTVRTPIGRPRAQDCALATNHRDRAGPCGACEAFACTRSAQLLRQAACGACAAVEYSPFYGIEKGAVLQEARIFNDPHIDPRRCQQVCSRPCAAGMSAAP